MPMREYEDLKNLKIPAGQERIMDIICMNTAKVTQTALTMALLSHTGCRFQARRD